MINSHIKTFGLLIRLLNGPDLVQFGPNNLTDWF